MYLFAHYAGIQKGVHSEETDIMFMPSTTQAASTIRLSAVGN